MTTATTNKPYATLRDGLLKATVWCNTSPEGRPRYSVDITRSYTDKDGKWHDTHYFGRSEILRAARLAEKAYDLIVEAMAAEPNADDADNGGSS